MSGLVRSSTLDHSSSGGGMNVHIRITQIDVFRDLVTASLATSTSNATSTNVSEVAVVQGAFQGAFGHGEHFTHADTLKDDNEDDEEENKQNANTHVTQNRGIVLLRLPPLGTNDPDGDAISAFERTSLPAGLVVRRAPIAKPVDAPYLRSGGKLVLSPKSVAHAQAITRLRRRGCAVPLALKLAAKQRGENAEKNRRKYEQYVTVEVPGTEKFREALADAVGEANDDLNESDAPREQLLEPYLDLTLSRVAAAVSIQATWRAYLARQSLVPDLCSRALRRRACVFIQRWLRGRTMIRRLNMLHEVAARVAELSSKAFPSEGGGERSLMVTYGCQEALLRQQELCTALPKHLSLITEQRLFFTFDNKSRVVIVSSETRPGLPLWTGVKIPHVTLAQLSEDFEGLPPRVFTAHDVMELLRTGADMVPVEPNQSYRRLALEGRPYRRVTFSSSEEAMNRAALLVALTWRSPNGAQAGYAAHLEDVADVLARSPSPDRVATASVTLTVGNEADEEHSLVSEKENAQLILAKMLANKLPEGSLMRPFVGMLKAPTTMLQGQLARCLRSSVRFLSSDERLFARLLVRGGPRDLIESLRPDLFDEREDPWGRDVCASTSLTSYWHSLHLDDVDGEMVGTRMVHPSSSRVEVAEDAVFSNAHATRADTDFLRAARERARENLIRDVEMLKLNRASGAYAPMHEFSSRTGHCLNVNPPDREETRQAFETKTQDTLAALTASTTARRELTAANKAQVKNARVDHTQSLRDAGADMKLRLTTGRQHVRRTEDRDAMCKVAAIRKARMRHSMRHDASMFASAFTRQQNALTREIRIAEIRQQRYVDAIAERDRGEERRAERTAKREEHRSDMRDRKGMIRASAEKTRTFITDGYQRELDRQEMERNGVKAGAVRAKHWHSLIAPKGGAPFPIEGSRTLTHRQLPMTTVSRAEDEDDDDLAFEDSFEVFGGFDQDPYYDSLDSSDLPTRSSVFVDGGGDDDLGAAKEVMQEELATTTVGEV
ncbi:hypothetical protein PPROV_000321200 [Pycnococcus provasolii]|uniref:Uncharacterized protein n=1 Tax=Pycnococcus provasolii TaxID=41880 RepID=A0A830HCH8_9CHLO|nr:hypothetical protein PPROV_000321200 [Pycnococcus provasolii]